MKNFTYDDIISLSQKEAKKMAPEQETIKGYDIFYVDLKGYFGYSCLVFYGNRHIYYADDFQLHHNGMDEEELRPYYAEKLARTLFTDEEIGMPLHDYDEYRRKENFLRNFYIQQVDYLSAFRIGSSKEEEASYNRKKAKRVYDPVSFAYVKDIEFVKKHVMLFEDLLAVKAATAENYEYQKNAFIEEMFNHEYAINWQADYDTLSAFGQIAYRNDDDINGYFDELGFNDIQRRAYLDARREYCRIVNEEIA